MVRVKLLDARFFPAPSSIVGTFQALVSGPKYELLVDIQATLGRVGVGWLMGCIPGLLLGVAMGLSSPVRAFFKPMVAALFPIPKIAILPLIMLIFGLGEMSKYVSVAIGIVFLVLINTMAGVMNIEKIYLDVGRNFGASRWQFFRTIAIPGAMPSIFTGFQLSLGVALIVIVATEFVGAKTGIGYLIWQSWQTFSVEAMYCGLVTTAFLGFMTQMLLDTIQRIAIPWKPELHN
jgi:NitT/TauT family transport system permease protein